MMTQPCLWSNIKEKINLSNGREIGPENRLCKVKDGQVKDDSMDLTWITGI